MNRTSDRAVSVRDFRKRYGSFIAVDGISFEVKRGEIFGLLGPNGAGKTTTLECLEGLRAPDAGELSIFGRAPERAGRELSRLIGVQLQTSGLPGHMRVAEAMSFFCAYHRVKPRMDLLERLGLWDKRSSAYRALSVGQQRRLALALAIAHDPAVLFLDEPTAGLDVASRQALHLLMRELRERGTAIILATHDMAEAEKLSDRVAILLRGRIVVTGTPNEITAAGGSLTKISVRSEQSTLETNGRGLPGVVQRSTADDYAVFLSEDPGVTVSSILHHLAESGDPLVDLRVERPSLEERFLEITSPEATK